MRANRGPFIVKCVLVAAIAGVLAGCSAPQRETPLRRQYVLDVNSAGGKLEAGSGVLKVRRFRISSPFEGTSFVYRTGGVSYESDFYNEFLSPPAAMITEEVRQWLGASGIFGTVVDAGSHADARYALEGNIVALYGDYSDAGKPEAVMEIQVFLLDEAGPASSVAFSNGYRVVSSLESNSPAALAAGLNDCLEKILKEIERDLRAAVGRLDDVTRSR